MTTTSKPNPRIVILGAGAVGGLTASMLARAGEDVVLIDPWAVHVNAMRHHGLRVRTPEEEFTIRVAARHIEDLPRSGPIDYFLLSLKSYDTEWATRYALPYLAPDGVVLSLQNGMNERAIAAVAASDQLIGCVVHMSGFCPGPGEVSGICGKSWSAFSVGELEGPSRERTFRAAELLSAVGKTHVSNDIWSVLWSKLILNVASNPIAGLSGLCTAQLWSDDRTLPLLIHLAGEAVLVAEASGKTVADVTVSGAPEAFTPDILKAAHLGDAAAYERVCALFQSAAAMRVGKNENRSSLLQDVLKRRHAEVAHLNGYVVEEGARLGVATPVNAAVLEAIQELEEAGDDPAPERLERLRIVH